MPSSLVEVRTAHAPAVEAAIVEAVHDALVSAFAIPPQDRHVRLVVHEPHRFAVPPTLRDPALYTLVSIDAFAGRSVDAKRRLYAEVVRRLEVIGIPADHVTVIVRDLPLESWGIRGGQPACDVDLGFTVEV
jgi:phenylpyruvate tautomerase PptA (4-oxalocrotonate tautomerase family)